MLLFDQHRPFTEEERQAVVSIQSRFRTYQAQNTLDRVMRGERDAGAFQVLDALRTAMSMRKVVVDPENAFGIFATFASLRKAYPNRLARHVFDLTSTVFSASTFVDNVLALLSCVFLLFQCAAIYQTPIVAGMLIRSVFETSEGEMPHEQIALWMALFVAVAVSMFAVQSRWHRSSPVGSLLLLKDASPQLPPPTPG
jgi:hypothetical protein